jgi:predicted acylesterase/phospholipase RssA
MKGGVTSGVVYPLAVVELSKAFRLRNIGGASAGAIAAAAAAAAEYGRWTGTGGSFDQLEKLPRLLAEKPKGESTTRLFGFFQPQDKTKPVFNTVVAALGGGIAGALRVLLAGLSNFPAPALGGALPGAAILWFALTSHDNGLLRWIAIALGVAMLIVGPIVAAAIAFVRDALVEIPGNMFGLCTGFGESGDTKAKPLTPWLTQFLNELAGITDADRPLNFGDLCTADGSSGTPPAINLQMMTTCLSHGRPYRLPFVETETVPEGRTFMFREEDFRLLFPKMVVDWMVAHPRSPSPRPRDAQREETFRQQGFLPLPDANDFPVVVAVRMSLSFPILLSAVPLYAVDFSRVKEEDQVPERCWFSDGGITSNFPVHFFDATLPLWPTFAIDLTDEDLDHGPGVHLPNSNQGGALVKWYRFDAGAGLGRILSLLGQIVWTAKDWTDNAQVRLPGFRDRIAQVALEPQDGGLNLNMSDERIARLSGYGSDVGRQFVRRFTTDDPEIKLNWPNHRWVRLRSGLASVEEWLTHFNENTVAPVAPGLMTYEKLIHETDPPSYGWANKLQHGKAEQLFAALQDAASKASGDDAATESLSVKAPHPLPELQVRPRV